MKAKKAPAQICHDEKGTGRSQAAERTAGIRAKTGADLAEKTPREATIPTG